MGGGGTQVAWAPQPARGSRVYKTGGNRSGLTGYWSNRSGPVPVPNRPKFKFEFKKIKKNLKKILKILQGATNLMVSNFLKNSFV